MNTRTRVASPLFHRISIALACCALLAGCGGGGSHASMPAAIPAHGTGSATSTVATAPATFAFTYPKPSASAHKRNPHYLSSATASISLTVTDTKNHGDSTDIFANVPAAIRNVRQDVNFANTTGDPNTPGQCGTDPANAGNIKCTAVFQLPVGDNTLTISSHDAANGGGNLLSQQSTTVWTQQGAANTYSVSLDAQAGAVSSCPSPSIVIGLPGSGAGGAQCVGNAAGTIYFSGTSALAFPVTVKDAAGNTIPASAPGAPVIGASTTGPIVASTTPSSNPSQVTLTPNGTVGTGTLTVTASGLNSGTDGITQRSVTVNIQEDATVGNSGCPSPSILISSIPTGAGGSECSGASAGTITLTGTSALTFPITVKDGSGNAITAGSTGAPTLSASATGGIATVSASSNPYQVVITPNGTGGNGTVTLTTDGAHTGDGVPQRTITFNIHTAVSLIAVDGCAGGAPPCQINLYTYNGTTGTFTSYDTVTGATIGSTRGLSNMKFDGTNDLFIVDNSANKGIVKIVPDGSSKYSTGTISSVNGAFTSYPSTTQNAFDVGNDGENAVASGSPSGTSTNLSTYNVALSPEAAYAMSVPGVTGSPNNWYGESAAILQSGGTTFGYALAGITDTPTNNDARIAVLTPKSCTSCTAGFIDVGNTENLSNYRIAWNNTDQSLLVLDRPSPFKVYEYPISTSGTVGSPVTIAADISQSNAACTNTTNGKIATSRNGYIAVYCSGAAGTFIWIWDNTHAVVAGWNPKSLGATTVTSIRFLPDNSLMVSVGSTLTVYNVGGASSGTAQGSTTIPGITINDTSTTN